MGALLCLSNPYGYAQVAIAKIKPGGGPSRAGQCSGRVRKKFFLFLKSAKLLYIFLHDLEHPTP